MVAPNIYTHRKVHGLGWIKRGSPAEERYLRNKDKQKATAGKGKGAVRKGTGKGAVRKGTGKTGMKKKTGTGKGGKKKSNYGYVPT